MENQSSVYEILKRILKARKENPSSSLDDIIGKVAGEYEQNVEMGEINSFIDTTFAKYQKLSEAKFEGLSRIDFLKAEFDSFAKKKGLNEEQKEQTMELLMKEIEKHTTPEA